MDLGFELMEQSLRLQRRLVLELLGTLQVAMVEAEWDNPNTNHRTSADGAASRRRTAKRAA